VKGVKKEAETVSMMAVFTSGTPVSKVDGDQIKEDNEWGLCCS